MINLIALEKDSGKVACKVNRTFTCERETAQSYSTPLKEIAQPLYFGVQIISQVMMGDR